MQVWIDHTSGAWSAARRIQPSMFSIDLLRRSPSPFRNFLSYLPEVHHRLSPCEAVDDRPDKTSAHIESTCQLVTR